MSKTANINVRVDPEFKSKVENLYSKFGMSVTDFQDTADMIVIVMSNNQHKQHLTYRL